MKCPFCGNIDTQVKDSRPAEESNSVKRRRFCTDCDSKFTTFERVSFRNIYVIKNDGRKELLQRDKLTGSIEVAVRKRNVSEEKIGTVVNNIIQKIERGGEEEISSGDIGKAIMDELKQLDRVAYIRYASVYLDFDKIKDFADFIKSIK